MSVPFEMSQEKADAQFDSLFDRPLRETLEGYYAAMDGSEMAEDYHRRHGTKSACILTVTDDETASLITGYLEERITGKVVVEIGAGIGLLACHMADVASKVYAIEVDPAWTSSFLAVLYQQKPPNLTFIFGRAEDAPPFSADVAIFCAHSGHAALHAAASRFAPVVIDVYAELAATSPEGFTTHTIDQGTE